MYSCQLGLQNGWTRSRLESSSWWKQWGCRNSTSHEGKWSPLWKHELLFYMQTSQAANNAPSHVVFQQNRETSVVMICSYAPQYCPDRWYIGCCVGLGNAISFQGLPQSSTFKFLALIRVQDLWHIQTQRKSWQALRWFVGQSDPAGEWLLPFS